MIELWKLIQICAYIWVSMQTHGAPLVAQLVENLHAMQKTLVQFLGWEDPLEVGMVTHSSNLA